MLVLYGSITLFVVLVMILSTEQFYYKRELLEAQLLSLDP